ncbi:MAG TPA: cytochrome c biogenesis protein ResB [Desulfatiglandales bacterium]|nr:cytochrome c biogenesis protein ResB [Desulfatiglandales bacterium]
MKKRLISFFASVRLTIILLIMIALVSILGTVIPQQYGPGDTVTHLSPKLVDIFKSLQLFDIYHSVWFIVLMCLLYLNLIACSIKRFPTTWKLFTTRPSLDRSKPFEDLPPDNIVMIEGNRNEITSTVERLLQKRLKRFRKKDTDEATTFYGEKGAFSGFAAYVIHVSILVVIAGALIGSQWGFKAFVNIAEGESTDRVYVERQSGLKKLDFTVRCDKFSIAYYENGMPREYRSDLSFLKEDTVILQGPLRVNHPITVNGIRFYQANYGAIPGGKVHITITKANRPQTHMTVYLKDSFSLHGDAAKVTVERIEENLMSMGPAVLLTVHSPDATLQFWVFKGIEKMKRAIPDLLDKVPKFNPGRYKPYYFELNGIEQTFYTGLQLSHDPGVSVVAIGAFLIVAGFLVTFFSSHKRFWVRVDEAEGKTRIMVSARSNRDPVGLKRETEYLLRHIAARDTARLA